MSVTKMRANIALGAALAALMLGASACGSSGGSSGGSDSSGSGSTAADLNTMTTSQLYTQAKKEGKVVWYTSMPASDVPKVTAEFEKAYPGISVQGTYLSGSTPVTRIETEAKGGLHNADVVSGGGDAVLLEQAGLIDQSFDNAPGAPDTGSLKMPKGVYIDRIQTNVISYNPKALKAAGLPAPTSFSDFAKPEWNGKFSVDPTTADIVDALGTTEGYNTVINLFKKIGANHPIFVTSHSLSSSEVAAGTTVAAISTYGYTALSYEQKDPTTYQFVNVNPMPVGVSEVAVVKDAPDAAAARLFVDWIASKAGQSYFVSVLNMTSINADAGNPSSEWDPTKWKPSFENPTISTDMTNQLIAEYQQALGYSGK